MALRKGIDALRYTYACWPAYLRGVVMSFDDITFNHCVFWDDSMYGQWRSPRDPVVFENAYLGVRETIVDANGRIQNFPGIAHPEVVSAYTTRYTFERIEFRSTIKNLDGAWALVWLVEPDGSYWEDHFVYGVGPQPQVRLYARLDERGRFCEPFRLYDVDNTLVFGSGAEEELVASMADERDALAYLKGEVGAMAGEVASRLRMSGEVSVSRLLPGTCLVATLTAQRRDYECLAGVCVDRRFARVWPQEFARRRGASDLGWYLASDEGAADAMRAFQHLLDDLVYM